MANYTVYDPLTGEIYRSGTCDNNMIQAQEGGGLLSIEGTGSTEIEYVLQGEIVAYSEVQKVRKAARPIYPARWSNDSMQWIDLRNLDHIKIDHWNNIKLIRESELVSQLSTPYGVFDADPKSQKSITDAIMMLQTLESLGTPTTIDFTLADNSTVTLTTAQMVAVGLLLGSRTQQAYAHARDLKVLINAATTKEEVDAITW